jgi:hypothetical protein
VKVFSLTWNIFGELSKSRLKLRRRFHRLARSRRALSVRSAQTECNIEILCLFPLQ